MTFSFLARDASGTLLGVATASRSLAVGAGVPALDPAAGVVVSQAWTNRVLRHLVLTALRHGANAADALGRALGRDEGGRYRQLAVVARDGSVAAWTGQDTTAWAGHRTGSGWAAAGNLLTGPEVLDAMVRCYGTNAPPSCTTSDPTSKPAADNNANPGPIAHARRLLAALQAGEAAGGDARGRQSAALLVARVQPVAQLPPELVIDLRVDDDPDPISRLEHLLRLRANDLSQPSNGLTAPRTVVTPSEAFAHQWGVEQP